jgi:uncharacterized protein
LRPLLSALWCLEKRSIAPMTIGPLMTLLPADIKSAVSNLITLKATASEGFIVTVSAALQWYIDTTFKQILEASRQLKADHFEPDLLDAFFVKTIEQYDH